jgi:hypothetical protein
MPTCKILAVWLGVLALALPGSSGVSSPWSSRPLYAGAYGHDAVKRLAQHRSQILSQVWQAFDPSGDGAVGVNRFKPFLPFLTCPPDTKLEQFGGIKYDAGKQLCTLPGLQRPGCVVVSLGSNGDFTFEQAVLERTRCDVHTYDCTYDGASLQPGRHFYHKECVGQPPKAYPFPVVLPTFKNWTTLQKDWGSKPVEILKVDVEGYESSLLGQLHAGQPHLPQQIVMEVHLRHYGASELARQSPRDQAHLGLMFLHLEALGYGVFAWENNKWAREVACCAEFSLLRVEGPARGAGAVPRRNKPKQQQQQQQPVKQQQPAGGLGLPNDPTQAVAGPTVRRRRPRQQRLRQAGAWNAPDHRPHGAAGTGA